MKNVNFRYLNPIRSEDFNRRFADLTGGSLLSGFYFEKGSGAFDVTLTHKGDPSSVMVFPNGVRIEETMPLWDVVTLSPNKSGKSRRDWVYAKYEYGRTETIVEYIVVEDEDIEPLLDKNKFKCIGSIYLPNEATDLDDCTFEYEKRGLQLRNVVNDAVFTGQISFPLPEKPSSPATKSYVDELISEYREAVVSDFHEESKLYRVVSYYGSGDSLLAITEIETFNEEHLPISIRCTRFGKDATMKEEYRWFLEYDEQKQIIRKYKV